MLITEHFATIQAEIPYNIYPGSITFHRASLRAAFSALIRLHCFSEKGISLEFGCLIEYIGWILAHCLFLTILNWCVIGFKDIVITWGDLFYWIKLMRTYWDICIFFLLIIYYLQIQLFYIKFMSLGIWISSLWPIRLIKLIRRSLWFFPLWFLIDR